MCGSGWCVVEVLIYVNVIGVENIFFYSDGWMGWSFDNLNLIEVGEYK